MKNIKYIYIVITLLVCSCNSYREPTKLNTKIQVKDDHFMTLSAINQIQVINDSLCLVSGIKGDLFLCNYLNGNVVRQYDFNFDDSLLLKKYLEPVAKNIKILYPTASSKIPIISDMPKYQFFSFYYSPAKDLLYFDYNPKLVYTEKNDTVCDIVTFLVETNINFTQSTIIPAFQDFNPDSMAEQAIFINTCNGILADNDYFYLNNTPHNLNSETPCFLKFQRTGADKISLVKTFGKYPEAGMGRFEFKHSFEKNNGQWYYSNEEAIYTFDDSLILKPENLEKGVDKIWGFHHLNNNQMALYVYHIDTTENSTKSFAKLMTCDMPSGKITGETILFKAPMFGGAAFYNNELVYLYYDKEKYYFDRYEIK